MEAKDREKLKQIAIGIFGSVDGTRPKMPKRGESIQEAMEASLEAGIKKVVEWVEGELTSMVLGGEKVLELKMMDDEWQAQLKGWGVTKPEIDEAQELADLRHNASDDTIG